MTLEKLVIKCPRKPREDLWKCLRDFYKSSRGLRGHLITNFPNVMVLGKLFFLATQAFANPENISEPQTGIEPDSIPVWGSEIFSGFAKA